MTSAPQTAPGRIVVGIDGSRRRSMPCRGRPGRPTSTAASLEVVTSWEWPSELRLGHAGARGLRSRGRRPPDARRRPWRRCAPPTPACSVSERVVRGHPAPVLVEASKGAELLVVGSRGHGEFVGMVIGSVSEYCAAHAHCPVLVHRAA